jgi:hypothetical protein
MSRIGKKRITYEVLMKKRAAKRSFGRLRRAQVYNIKMVLKGIEWESVK